MIDCSEAIEELDKLSGWEQVYHDCLEEELFEVTNDMVRYAKTHHSWKSRTGAAGLEGAIRGEVERLINQFVIEWGAYKEYASYVEYGTTPGQDMIRPKPPRKALRWNKSGSLTTVDSLDTVYRKWARQVPHKPYPFMEPTLKLFEPEIKARINMAFVDAQRKLGLL